MVAAAKLTSEENARLVAFYSAARAEVVQRLVLREQTLIAYLTVSGVVAGLAYRTQPPTYFMLQIVPLASLPFAITLLRHEWIIANIGDYLHKNLGDALDIVDKPVPWNIVRDWDRSKSYIWLRSIHIALDRLTFAALLLGPAVLCFIVVAVHEGRQHIATTVCAAVALLLTIGVLLVDIARLTFQK